MRDCEIVLARGPIKDSSVYRIPHTLPDDRSVSQLNHQGDDIVHPGTQCRSIHFIPSAGHLVLSHLCVCSRQLLYSLWLLGKVHQQDISLCARNFAQAQPNMLCKHAVRTAQHAKFVTSRALVLCRLFQMGHALGSSPQ